MFVCRDVWMGACVTYLLYVLCVSSYATPKMMYLL